MIHFKNMLHQWCEIPMNGNGSIANKTEYCQVIQSYLVINCCQYDKFNGVPLYSIVVEFFIFVLPLGQVFLNENPVINWFNLV